MSLYTQLFVMIKSNAVKNLRKLELSKIADTNVYWKSQSIK